MAVAAHRLGIEELNALSDFRAVKAGKTASRIGIAILLLLKEAMHRQIEQQGGHQLDARLFSGLEKGVVDGEVKLVSLHLHILPLDENPQHGEAVLLDATHVLPKILQGVFRVYPIHGA